MKRFGVEPRLNQELAGVHGHASTDSCERAPFADRHCAMRRSSSGSGLSGSVTLSATNSSPRPPPLRGTPLPLRRSTVPVFDHFGTVMVTGPAGVGTLTLPPSTASASGI